MKDYVYITHSLGPVWGRMVHHRPALSPMDVNYNTRSLVFQAKRDGIPYFVPMVCRWQRGR